MTIDVRANWTFAALFLAAACGSQSSGPATTGNPASGSGQGTRGATSGTSPNTTPGRGASSSGSDTVVPGSGSNAGAGNSGGSPTQTTGSGGEAPSGDAGPDDTGSTTACSKDLSPTVIPEGGLDNCTIPLKPNDDRNCTINYNGTSRTFLVYATPNFNPCQPATLIMDCHGLSETDEVQAGKAPFVLDGMTYPNGYGSSWRMAVQAENAVVVTPQGVGNSWTPATDVPFVNKVAETVEAIASVNPDRVYVTGISMGGQMTVATGCGNADRWRGMAPVSMLSETCAKLSKPTPVISFHSKTDELTSYSDDSTLMQNIATMNNCKTGPTPAMQYGGAMSSPDKVCFVTPNGVGDPSAPNPYNIPLQACPTSATASTCVSWTQCDDGVEVIFCTVAASKQPLGGHILYNNDTQLDLSAVMWPFFKKFWK